MRCKVLLIDDECNTAIGREIIGYAEQEGIDIDACESHEEGMQILDSKRQFYHAVILDAKVKKMKDDTVLGLEGLAASRDRLIEINKSDYLPYFIFTAQPDYQKADWFRQSYGNYFIKGQDNQKLLDAIKVSIEKKEEYIVQKKYREVFDVCNGKYIDNQSSDYLLTILLYLEFLNKRLDDDLFFNRLRKIVEFVFRAANKFGFLHDNCINNDEVNLTWSSLFLAGKEVELKPTKTKIRSNKVHFPNILEENVRHILNITNTTSHTEGDDKENGKLAFKKYKQHINSPFLLCSLTYQVLDLLLWFKSYVDSNPDKEVNKKCWETIYPSQESSQTTDSEWINGSVARIATNGWGTFEPNSIGIHPETIKKYNLTLHQKIAITTKKSSDGLKTHIDLIRIIN